MRRTIVHVPTMDRSIVLLASLAGAVAASAAACIDPTGEAAASGHQAGASTSASGAGGGAGGGVMLAGASGRIPVFCGQDPHLDGDGDGWTPAEGDCDDCDLDVNPGAV